MNKKAALKVLDDEVFSNAVEIVERVREMVSQAAVQMGLCPCCGEPNELLESVGSVKGMEVLLANAVMALLGGTYDDITVDLRKVLGSVKALKDFRKQQEFEQLLEDNAEVE